MDQFIRPDEKRSPKNLHALTDNNAFGGDEIRQLQMLMVLFSCLPPKGKVRELLELALALPDAPCLSRISPLRDTSFHGLKTWLESLWVQEGLTPDEQKLVAWQRSGEQMIAAVQELKEVEQQLGLKLVPQRRE
jgi:hypothetical protein